LQHRCSRPRPRGLARSWPSTFPTWVPLTTNTCTPAAHNASIRSRAPPASACRSGTAVPSQSKTIASNVSSGATAGRCRVPVGRPAGTGTVSSRSSVRQTPDRAAWAAPRTDRPPCPAGAARGDGHRPDVVATFGPLRLQRDRPLQRDRRSGAPEVLEATNELVLAGVVQTRIAEELPGESSATDRAAPAPSATLRWRRIGQADDTTRRCGGLAVDDPRFRTCPRAAIGGGEQTRASLSRFLDDSLVER